MSMTTWHYEWCTWLHLNAILIRTKRFFFKESNNIWLGKLSVTVLFHSLYLPTFLCRVHVILIILPTFLYRIHVILIILNKKWYRKFLDSFRCCAPWRCSITNTRLFNQKSYGIYQETEKFEFTFYASAIIGRIAKVKSLKILGWSSDCNLWSKVQSIRSCCYNWILLKTFVTLRWFSQCTSIGVQKTSSSQENRSCGESIKVSTWLKVSIYI